MKVAAIIAILIVLAVYVSLGAPLPCSATLTSYPDGGTSEHTSGFAVRTEGLVGKPLKGGVTVRGDGKYKLQFSKNVDKIRLLSGAAELYAGAPVESYTVPRGPFSIELQTTASPSVTQVSIAGSCSVKSLWQSFE